ncbi:MFS transporter [Roseovarius aquimarinus]|uniref:BT1 family protein n=1 Tax=Roseovarius aquimarinus TaxID=1229156 RepID=A0ABW7I7C5_9RHOB
MIGPAAKWIDATLFELARQMRWSYLPPLMVYLAYGISTITGIVGTFFVKEYLGLSAAFLAGLAFWAGLPWALKMPLGHLVDIIWKWKGALVWLGAGLVAGSLGVMYQLVAAPGTMAALMPIEAWYVGAMLLMPCGLVLQDAVADGMSVEAVPVVDAQGAPLDEETSRALHTTMQTLGRIALIGGTLIVSAINITVFAGVEDLPQEMKADIYARIYAIAMIVPVISVSGVMLAAWQRRRAIVRATRLGHDTAPLMERPGPPTEVNPWYFIGGGAFVALSLGVGLLNVPFAQEIVFAGSMGIVLVLMRQLMRALDPAQARMLVGTALIVFVFRAVPLPGPGATWFVIDGLGFDAQFLSVLGMIAALLTLAAMLVLRPYMARRRLTRVYLVLTIIAGVLALPNIALYYGIQNITAPLTFGIVDARFIAVLDTAAESPLSQIALIPMLAWIARNAPAELKATFFAVMASFTNLALSASSLATKYLNEIFTVTREVTDRETGAVTVPADYSELGMLLIVAGVLTVALPLATIWLVQRSRLRTSD